MKGKSMRKNENVLRIGKANNASTSGGSPGAQRTGSNQDKTKKQSHDLQSGGKCIVEVDNEVMEKCLAFQKTLNSSTRRVLPDWVYRDTSNCFGGVVKESRTVLEKLKVSHERVNMNCTIEMFGCIVSGLNQDKRQWIVDMGMQGLLHFAGKGLPRRLAYWLLTRVHVPHKSLLTIDGREFPLSKVQVHWVLGIPFCGKPPPLTKHQLDDSSKKDMEEIWKEFSQTTPGGTTGISRTKLMEVVINTSQELVFKKAFLMLALTDVLCPTTCHRLSTRLLPAVTVVKNAANYDWCTLVLDHLVMAAKNFAKSFYANGFAKGGGGCVYFLVVLYLDRLDRYPMQWGCFPRIKAWSDVEIKKASREDLSDLGDFGKLGSVDAAYGEPHPNGARDLMPSMVDKDQIANLLRGLQKGISGSASLQKGTSGSASSEISIPWVTGKPRKRRQVSSTGMGPYHYKLRRKAQEEAEQGYNVGSTAEKYGERMPSSEKNKICVIDEENIISAIKKGVRGMNTAMEQVEKCKKNRMNICDERNVDSVAGRDVEITPRCKRSCPTKSHDNCFQGLLSQITQTNADEVVSLMNSPMAAMKANEILEDASCIRIGMNSRLLEVVHPQDEILTPDDNDHMSKVGPDKKKHSQVCANDEQDKGAKVVRVKSEKATLDDKVVTINPDNEDDNEDAQGRAAKFESVELGKGILENEVVAHCDSDPFGVLQFDARISKLERVVFKMEARQMK